MRVSRTRTSARRLRGRMGIAAVGVTLLLGGCVAPGDDDRPDASGSTDASSSPAPTPSSSPTPSEPTEEPEPTTADARIGAVPPAQWAAMLDAGMVRPECPIQRPGQLRRIDINHLDFDGEVQRGHLIVHRDTARTTTRIFTRLFDLGFPIERMVGVEEFGGDVNASLRANNTSAYNCRRADQINAPFADSPHANGRAVDVNPVQNPWRDLRCDCWSPSPTFAKRTPGPGKVLRGDPVWRTFIDEGWIWQNISVADYMHFDTGYPSRPYAGRR